jgi:hypothetical protein
MVQHQADIVVFGAGIAGLWVANHFKALGYDVLVLEANEIGGGQSIASQGIIHSGLKYALSCKINALAKSISAMPDLWRAALKGEGNVDLSKARMNADSQYLLIPSGFMGGLIGLVTKQALGSRVREVPKAEWPQEIQNSGFRGSMIYMDEPVLNISSVISVLSSNLNKSVKHIDAYDDPIGFLKLHNIAAQHIIFTSAASNAEIAKKLQHDAGLETQKRPLLMGLMKNAPFEIYAHMVGPSDKPVATITTHKAEDGSLVWYLGGAIAERAKEADPAEVYKSTKDAFKKYFPKLNLSDVEWATLPIDRVEGKSETDGWMPDTPTIHQINDIFYCWPTKLTFAPLLAQRLAEKITAKPSGIKTDWSFLPDAIIAKAPWDKVQWEKDT